MSSLAQDLAETFTRVREHRDRLNDIDNELVRTIQHVEATLADIRPGVPVDVEFASRHQGEPAQWLSFQKHNGAWRLMHGYADSDKQSSLLGATREVRAEVFDTRRPSGVAPIVMLILEMPKAIEEIASDRGFALCQARHLSQGLISLGFPQPAV